MLWDRKLVEAVWGYQYSWEIYTPAAKRRFGYYVLPMLYGEDLVGRVEAATDRKNQVLLVKNIWFEEGVRRTKRLEHAIEMSIKRLARFNDCKEIQYKEKETI